MRYRPMLILVFVLVFWHTTALALIFWPGRTASLPPLPTQAPDIASYRMQVQLDPATKTVVGTARITYHNLSPDSLEELWLRLYLKAFRSTETLWMREAGLKHRGFAVDTEALGNITVSQLTLPDGTDLLASATFTDTLMHVPLPAPLQPDQRIELDVAWISTLPRVFARTGYGGRDDTFFMVGQWYPKMVVYDRGAWDAIPWHANAEFFHDFGSYDVQITVPQEYVVAGVGVPTDTVIERNGFKTVHYTADNVTDFAFAASPDFQIASAPAGDVEVVLYYLPEHTAAVSEYLEVATGALQTYREWYGDYPHPRLTVVDVPDNAAGAGGMEYPTLITGGTFGAPLTSDFIAFVVAHEVAHQWWPMQVATHEGREPWLDEGLTQYTGNRYMLDMGRMANRDPHGLSAFALDRAQYATIPTIAADRPAWEYRRSDYGVAVYSKPAIGFLMLERVVGTARFRQALADYLAAYRYQHPTAAEFRAVLARSLNEDLSWFFDDFIGGNGVIDYAVGPIENRSTGSSITVLRVGTIQVPVDIRVTFASGAQQTIVWNGTTDTFQQRFSARDPVLQVELDPEFKLVAELNRADNAAQAVEQ